MRKRIDSWRAPQSSYDQEADTVGEGVPRGPTGGHEICKVPLSGNHQLLATPGDFVSQWHMGPGNMGRAQWSSAGKWKGTGARATTQIWGAGDGASRTEEEKAPVGHTPGRRRRRPPAGTHRDVHDTPPLTERGTWVRALLSSSIRGRAGQRSCSPFPPASARFLTSRNFGTWLPGACLPPRPLIPWLSHPHCISSVLVWLFCFHLDTGLSLPV